MPDLDATVGAELQEAANNVLWVLVGGAGYPPGSFTEALIKAMARADRDNLNLLLQVFTALAICVHAYKNDPDGVEQLHRWAKGDMD